MRAVFRMLRWLGGTSSRENRHTHCNRNHGSTHLLDLEGSEELERAKWRSKSNHKPNKNHGTKYQQQKMNQSRVTFRVMKGMERRRYCFGIEDAEIPYLNPPKKKSHAGQDALLSLRRICCSMKHCKNMSPE